MIESITFAKKAKEASYEFRLDSLKGKTFDFKKGVNVIVGRNGSGKTSLLNVIRELTWCKKKIHSYYGETGDRYNIRDVAEKCMPFATMRNDFSKSVFNVRGNHDIGNDNFEESIANFSQIWSSFRRSSGENVLDAINICLHSFIDEQDDSRHLNQDSTRDFNKMVLDRLKSDAKGVNECWTECYSTAISFCEKNHVQNDDYTILMDEPDKGLDVFGIERVFGILGGSKDFKYPIQIIAIVHNIALISRLMADSRVNFIEMSEGYLEAVKKFAKTTSV